MTVSGRDRGSEAVAAMRSGGLPHFRRVHLQAMLLTETVLTGRKTPRDGRLELPRPLHEALVAAATGEAVPLALPADGGDKATTGLLDAFGCGCGPDGEPHLHRFVRHPWFATLPAGTPLAVRWDGAVLRVTRSE
jgi:hypothetical protein